MKQRIYLKDCKTGMRISEVCGMSAIYCTMLEDAAPTPNGEYKSWKANVRREDNGEIVEMFQTEGYEHYGPNLFLA